MSVTEFIIKQAKERVPVMAGCGSNSTKESIELSKHAYASGAKGNLLVTPYYNKPSENGLYTHLKNYLPKVAPLFLFFCIIFQVDQL